jgi:hypothetical protein
MASPIIMEYSKIKKEYPEFTNSYDQTLAEAKRQAESQWGLTDGGIYPGPNQYGVTGLRPWYFQIGTTSGKAETWNRNLGTIGWQDVINNTTIKDVYVGVLGFVLPNVSQRIGAIRIEAGNQKFSVIELEGEISVMQEPAVIFEKGIVIPDQQPVLLRAHAVTKGYNVIKPLGFAIAKQKILISETPATS